jgi:hypothetical protein
MINEIWLIHDGICIYHKILKDPLNTSFKGLNLDKQLFSGFITALINFTKIQLEDNTSLQKISFNDGVYDIVQIEKILAVLSLNTNFLSEQKLKQSVLSLTDEISYVVQTNEKLEHLRLEKKSFKPVLLSLYEYNTIFDSFLDKVLEDLYIIQNQLVMVDILTLVQILDDLTVLFEQLQVSSKILEYILGLSEKSRKIISKIELLKEEQMADLFQIQKELKKVAQLSIKSIKKDDLLTQNDLYKKLLIFVKKNYTILKQFQLEDSFFQEFIVII